DRAPSEASAGHSGTIDSLLLGSEIHHKVELFTAHLVVIAETLMGIRHQFGQRLNLAVLEGQRCRSDAVIFRNDMAASLVYDLPQTAAVLFQLSEPHISQSADAGQYFREFAHSLLTFGAADVVLARAVPMLDHRIANDQIHSARNRNQLVVQRPAIQHESMPWLTVTRDELVHDAAAGANEFILRALAE